ncbi:hypothetical protein [Streptomyces torulosus]|uniref:hypothetical protein n=1 Tax=Streptomyces torulosus TaxID=68276 RepID=UPI0006EB88F2|nr:hypothetical protein [Streptomyces torulosus]
MTTFAFASSTDAMSFEGDEQVDELEEPSGDGVGLGPAVVTTKAASAIANSWMRCGSTSDT